MGKVCKHPAMPGWECTSEVQMKCGRFAIPSGCLFEHYDKDARIAALEAECERLKRGRKYVCEIHGTLRTDDTTGGDLAWCPICAAESAEAALAAANDKIDAQQACIDKLRIAEAKALEAAIRARPELPGCEVCKADHLIQYHEEMEKRVKAEAALAAAREKADWAQRQRERAENTIEKLKTWMLGEESTHREYPAHLDVVDRVDAMFRERLEMLSKALTELDAHRKDLAAARRTAADALAFVVEVRDLVTKANRLDSRLFDLAREKEKEGE